MAKNKNNQAKKKSKVKEQVQDQNLLVMEAAEEITPSKKKKNKK